VPPGNLTGIWKASPAPGTEIALTIRQDGGFQWSVTSQGKTQNFEGNSTSANGMLTLARTNAGNEALVGQTIWQNPDHFNFKLMGGPADDSGLAFSRGS
jgi:hypothetical protein